MFPQLQTSVDNSSSHRVVWAALAHAAQHNLHILMASTQSRVHKKTAFGMSVVVTKDGKLSAGYQRIVFPLGKSSDASAMIIGNMAELALAQSPIDSPVKQATTHLRPSGYKCLPGAAMEKKSDRGIWYHFGVSSTL